MSQHWSKKPLVAVFIHKVAGTVLQFFLQKFSQALTLRMGRRWRKLPSLTPRPCQGKRKSIIVKTGQTILFFMDQKFNLYGSDIARGHQYNSILTVEKEFFSALFQHCLKQREKRNQYTKERASRTQTEDIGAYPLQHEKRLRSKRKKLDLEGGPENLWRPHSQVHCALKFIVH